MISKIDKTFLTRSECAPMRLKRHSLYAPIDHAIPDIVHPWQSLNRAYSPDGELDLISRRGGAYF